VVLGLGWNKRKAVMRALQEDLCNVLIIDDSLALGLLDASTYR
jgi:DNA-binding transcriptional regulator LsrR (DeoR family)